MVLGRFLLVMKTRFLLLQMSGISEEYGTQIDGGRRGKNWSVESFFGQPGNPAAVVEMRVRQDYGIDVARRNRSVFPVAQPPIFRALKKTAVNQHLHAGLVRNVVARIDEVFRSGDGSGSA